MRRVAVITGASAGLGAEFARQLRAEGYELLVVARRAERLAAIEGERWVADLSGEAEVERLAAHLASRDDIALLVNNAGFGTQGFFAETALEAQMAMHRLHVLATVRLTRAVLPQMLRRRAGAIVNVSSVAGFGRSANNVSYCATKAWTNAFSEGLWLELQGTGVSVQALCPGFTYTEFHDVMGSDRAKHPRWMWMDAAFVVEESLRNLGRLYVVPGWKYKVFLAIWTKLPAWLRLRLERRLPNGKGAPGVIN
jgi:short-subunit dehydrogenase